MLIEILIINLTRPPKAASTTPVTNKYGLIISLSSNSIELILQL